jgi:hypothetical protein
MSVNNGKQERNENRSFYAWLDADVQFKIFQLYER